MNEQDRRVQVVIACARPEARAVLEGIVERDAADVIGEAESAREALQLIRDLKPDVALIDYHVPHAQGDRAAPMSRAGGLDVAQAVAQDMPHTRAVLLSNLDTEALADRSLRWSGGIFTGADPEHADLIQQQAEGLAPPSGGIIFAHALTRPWSMLTRKSTLPEKFVFFGSLAIFGGACMIITLFLAQVGIFVVAAGAALALLGLAMRPLSGLRRRAARRAG